MKEKIKQHISVKKIIFLILLLATVILVLARRGSYHEVREYYALNFFEEQYDLLSQPDQTIRQTFVAKQDYLDQVNMRFYIEDLVDLRGKIKVSIEDEDQTTVAFSRKKMSSLTQTETASWTHFPMDCTLEKGKTYTLVIQTTGVEKEGDQVCNLYLASNRWTLFKDLEMNGDASNKRLVATFNYNTYCLSDLIVMLVLLMLTAVLVLESGTGRVRNGLCKVLNRLPKVFIQDGNRFLSRLLFLLTPLLAFFIVQTFSGYNLLNFLGQAFSIRGLFNLLLYSLILILAYLLTNRTKYAAVLTLLISYAAGLANYFVWNFRDCPIVAADFASIRTAMNVADQYDYSLGMWGVWATVLLVCFVTILCLLDTRKGLKIRQRIILLLVEALLTTGTWGIFFKSDLMKDLDITVSVWMPERDYAKNGSALSFLLTWTYYVVDKPEGYSAQGAANIVEGYVSDEADGETEERTPNIIAIMNESFADLAVDTPIETTKDYMPFIHNLQEDTVKGSLYVSVKGGNTANTEFEFLTGNSLAFFPSRSIPYNSYVKEGTGSLTWTLKAQGYQGNLVVHPYYSSGWNREVVYPLLGFSTFLSEEDFSKPSRVREFISDQSDFDRLIQEYEIQRSQNDDPFYEFTVTMQNHGGYAGTHGLVDEEIKVTTPANVNDQVTQYLNLIRLSDQAFEDLVSYFERIDEPTLIVMFGDHQPGFTDSVYDDLMGADTNSLGIEDTAKMYQVPYVIWANYDIEEEDLDMSANYLSAYLLNLAGAKMTGYQKYLLDLMEELPVITAICYEGDDGVLHAREEESEYSDLIRDYQIVQYNNMFDTKNRVDDFYFLKE